MPAPLPVGAGDDAQRRWRHQLRGVADDLGLRVSPLHKSPDA
jgi:hypothetical protein